MTKTGRVVDRAVQGFWKSGCDVGKSVGGYDRGRVGFYNYGTVSKTAPALPSARSEYEIASISKTFTGALAAEVLLDGKLRLDGDFRAYLKGDYPNLVFHGKVVSYWDFADQHGLENVYQQSYGDLLARVWCRGIARPGRRWRGIWDVEPIVYLSG